MDETDESYLVGLSIENNAENVAKRYIHACRSDEAVIKELKQRGLHKYHALEDHNYWISVRCVPCPYCNLFPDSKPVPRVNIKEMLKK